MPSLKALNRRLREARFIAKGLLSTRHVLLAHLIPIRRCNLSCTYCNEFDEVSKPVPTEELLRRIDKLSSFGTGAITLSGGEPLLHPEIERVITAIRASGAIAGIITNGYLLTPEKIHALNRAGLDHLQISIDNLKPDEVSLKSLKVLDKKLEALAEHAAFGVNINSVIGGGIKNPEDAVVIAKRALALGLANSLGIIHDGNGHVRPLSEREARVYAEMKALPRSSYSRLNKFQENLAQARPNAWRCRAGARYLYICEDGLVHWCSQQRGYPGVPLADYTLADLKREFYAEKPCAPMCTVGCVQQVAMIDNWRAPQQAAGRGKQAPSPSLPVIDRG